MFFRTRVFIGLGVAIALTLGALAAAGLRDEQGARAAPQAESSTG
jgi:hypothetical protein